MEGPLLSNNDHHIVDIRDSSYSSLCFMHGLKAVINMIDFITTIVKVITAIIVLTETKGQHSEAIWIITDTCACILNFPIVCWNLWQIHDPTSEIRPPISLTSDGWDGWNNEDDITYLLRNLFENLFSCCFPRIIDMEYVLSCLKTMLHSFFVVWCVAFFWVFLYRSSSLDHSSDLYSLCVIYLIIGCIRYVAPMVLNAALGCCLSIPLCLIRRRQLNSW